MPTTTKALARGAFATGSTTLYTVPSATTAVVTNIVITNTAGSAGTSLATTVSVAANSITTIDLKQVLSATQTITGQASATTINYHISGVEIA
jgi:hypothetical protein